MITRLLMHKDAVLQSLANHRHGLTLPSEAEWGKIAVLKSILEPCEKASQILGGANYVTISVVLPVVSFLKKKMTVTDDDPGYVRKFKEAFYVCLVNKLGKIDDDSSLQIATALDPRFKSLKCIEKPKRATVWSLLERLVSDRNSNSSSPQPPSKKVKTTMFDYSESESEGEDCNESYSDHKLQVSLYKSSKSEADIDKDPLKYWCASTSTLRDIARDYLSIPATSVPVERLFSSAGELVSRKRNSLSPENANIMLSLYC